jgi:tetratricopeptide (TPR) repeat protein
VSSAGIRSHSFTLLLFFVAGVVICWAQGNGAQADGQAGSRQSAEASADPAEVFHRGQDALSRGDLQEAERDFRRVTELDPRSGAAYANLGVVYMRRKQWSEALGMLEKARQLLPEIAGIRLNIGLAYYRRNEFLKAIPAFESVVREQPDALQPRYLLGLCYFFVDRWADASETLEPLWGRESENFPYLYVLSNAAHRAGRTELDERASAQLVKVGNDSAEYHLFAGKYHLNREEYDLAIGEFEAAAKADPKLPFVHFNLGLAYLKKQEYDEARQQFLKDAALEPDLALNYDELGQVYWLIEDDKNAERSFREALALDSRLANSHLGLARIYQRQKKYAAALAEADAALKADPARTDAHYIRGQLLLHLGRKQEAKKEMTAAAQGEKPGGAPVPSPELLQDRR